MNAQALEMEKRAYPLKFLTWLYIVSMVMIFAGLTSAMLVSLSDNLANNSWLHFNMPVTFLYSSLIILASSITLWWSHRAAKRNQYGQVRAGLWATLLLAIVFLTAQYIGFSELYDMGVRFIDNDQPLGNEKKVYNVSGSFFMILVGMHALHIVAGLVVLLVQLVRAFRYRINAQNTLGLFLTGIFWHSMGVLWIYLYVFLYSIY